MQTWEAITSRRNVRSFAGRPIPAADLDQILEAGRRSPSSQNWQPWDFIVHPGRRERLPFGVGQRVPETPRGGPLPSHAARGHRDIRDLTRVLDRTAQGRIRRPVSRPARP